jgi:hypothetical protein
MPMSRLVEELSRVPFPITRSKCLSLGSEEELDSAVESGEAFRRRVSRIYAYAASAADFNKGYSVFTTAASSCTKHRFLIEDDELCNAMIDLIRNQTGQEPDFGLMHNVCDELVREGVLLEFPRAGRGEGSDFVFVVRYHSDNADFFKRIWTYATNRLALSGLVSTEELYATGKRLGVRASGYWAHRLVDYFAYMGYAELVNNTLFAPQGYLG